MRRDKSLIRYNDYDLFARVYNLHWGSYGTRVYPILEHLVLRHLPAKAPSWISAAVPVNWRRG